MTDMLDISEVVRRTGLSSRTLRYYEARGLVAPVRTQSDRRAYGEGELARIAQIVALKRAGLTLAQIKQLVANRPTDLARLVDAQLAALVVRQQQAAEAMKLLVAVSNRLQKGESVDVAMLCELIRKAESTDELKPWKAETARQLLTDDRARMAVEGMWAVLSRVDPEEHRRKCEALYARIDAALPLEPDSPAARAFVEEWQALQAPFKDIAMTAPLPPAPPVDDPVAAIDRWNQAAQACFSAEAWQFLFMAVREQERNAAGK